jgi:carbonic anhydrase
MVGDDSLIEGNRAYAERGVGELPPLPRRGLVILTCMDHRIDPAAALGLELGDAMVLRNPGGRVTPQVIKDLETLDRIARARGASLAELEFVLMQHTLCGANALTSTEPREGVRADIEALANEASMPGSVSVTGLVYDTESGRVELIERRAPQRPD